MSDTSPASPFLFGHAQSPHWEKAAEQCLQQIGYVPPEANLGFLYLTDTYADLLPDIVDFLRAETGVEHWTGTVGIAICATGKEYYQASAMAVMIASLPPDGFRVLPFYNRAADHLPGGWSEWLAQSARHLAVVHGDPANGNLPVLIRQLAGELPGGRLVGGLSSSHGGHPQIADGIVDGGLSGVVFNERVPVLSALTQGCTPIGPAHRVTSCEQNIINTLDDQPALAVFKQDIGEILARDLDRAAGYIFAGIPVGDGDDYLVRNLLGIDTHGQRIAIGDMLTQGQPLQFCRRDGSSAWQDLQRMVDELKDRLDGRAPRGALYYSCLGRGRELFGEQSGELRHLQRSLGDIPLVGFFANGEICGQRLYGYTGVLTLFL